MVTSAYIRLHPEYILLPWVAYAYTSLHMVTPGYIWLYQAAVGYIQLQWVIYHYIMLHK